MTETGATVSLPIGHSPDYDLIAELGGRLLRVQVKTSTCQAGSCFRVQLSTYGGNQSWNGVVKKFDCSRCDYMFALVADGRRWFIPSKKVEATRTLILGGSKYASFEIGKD